MMDGVSKKLFIIAGPHKTGTTFIEVAILPSYKNITHQWKSKSDTLTDVLKIKQFDKVSVINEGICGHYLFNYDNRDTIIKNLYSLFPNASIVLSYREHYRYISSMYSGYITAGGSLKFHEFFSLTNASFINPESISFKDIHLEFKKYFKDIFVFNIDRINENKQNFLCKFSKFLNEEAPDLNSIDWTPKNKSISSFWLNSQRMLNTIVKPKYSHLKPKRNYLSIPLRSVFFLRTSIYHHLVNPFRFMPNIKSSHFSIDQKMEVTEFYKKDLDYILSVDSVVRNHDE